MKNLIIIIAIVAFSFSSAMANNGSDVIAAVNNEVIEYTVSTFDADDYIADMAYNMEKEQLTVDTYTTVSMMEVLDANGESVFVVPVGGSKLIVSTDSLDSGSYTVNFMFEGETEFRSTELVKK